ncbi:MAG: hypothetical protein A3J80_10055 [Desulfobacula sp. RIFOXYB2_FULL_45_6]|nr:MAG: hypothetical protein A3J80_10055 [Desulfobacula sp. RIFOXYB2_FULL_45_6]
MTNHHDAHHPHDHSHSHSHDHDHDHGHTHELSFEQKLEKLFAHWIDHNDSHKETFMTWAKRAKEANLDTVAEDIQKAGQVSGEITRLLKEGLKKLKG